MDRLRARRGAPGGHRRRRAHDRRAARSGRRDDRRPPAAQRPRRAARARAARRGRRGLRGAAERDDRLLGAVHQVRQRDRAARLVDGGQLQRGAGRRWRARRSRWPGCPPARSRSSPAATATSCEQLATQDGVVDLIIPRGGEGLKKALKEHATVPVMYAAAGNCHVYVDATADLDDAAGHHRQRQGAAARRVQRRRDAAGARRRRAATSCRACSPSCATAGVELRVDGAPARRWPAGRLARRRDRRGLGHRVPRADPGGEGRGLRRRGDRRT